MKKSIFWLKKLAKAATGEARIHRDDTYTEGTCKYCNAVLVHHRRQQMVKFQRSNILKTIVGYAASLIFLL